MFKGDVFIRRIKRRPENELLESPSFAEGVIMESLLTLEWLHLDSQH